MPAGFYASPTKTSSQVITSDRDAVTDTDGVFLHLRGAASLGVTAQDVIARRRLARYARARWHHHPRRAVRAQ